MTTVLVVGMVVMDFVFDVDVMPASAEKYIASNASMVGGGGAANAAVAIANLGGRAVLSGRIGDDMIGDLIVSDLQRYNVDCSLLQRTSGARSSYSSVLIDASGERLIVNFRGENLSDDIEPMRRLAAQTTGRPAAILADTRWSKGVVAAMKLARQLGVPGILDAEAPLEPEALHEASHIAFSRQGLVSLTGDDNLQRSLLQVAETYRGWLCVTDGADGAYYLDDGTVHNVPAPEIEVVDTLGAGDTWHGAFALAMASICSPHLGEPGLVPPAEKESATDSLNKKCGLQYAVQTERDAIRFANAAASLTCCRAGGGRVSPSLAEVSDFLAQQKM